VLETPLVANNFVAKVFLLKTVICNNGYFGKCFVGRGILRFKMGIFGGHDCKGTALSNFN